MMRNKRKKSMKRIFHTLVLLTLVGLPVFSSGIRDSVNSWDFNIRELFTQGPFQIHQGETFTLESHYSMGFLTLDIKNAPKGFCLLVSWEDANGTQYQSYPGLKDADSASYTGVVNAGHSLSFNDFIDQLKGNYEGESLTEETGTIANLTIFKEETEDTVVQIPVTSETISISFFEQTAEQGYEYHKLTGRLSFFTDDGALIQMLQGRNSSWSRQAINLGILEYFYQDSYNETELSPIHQIDITQAREIVSTILTNANASTLQTQIGEVVSELASLQGEFEAGTLNLEDIGIKRLDYYKHKLGTAISAHYSHTFETKQIPHNNTTKEVHLPFLDIDNSILQHI